MCQRTGLDFQDSGRLYLQVLQPVLDLGALVLVLLLALSSCALVLGLGDGSILNVVKTEWNVVGSKVCQGMSR
jgi:hypothetical protein